MQHGAPIFLWCFHFIHLVVGANSLSSLQGQRPAPPQGRPQGERVCEGSLAPLLQARGILGRGKRFESR